MNSDNERAGEAHEIAHDEANDNVITDDDVTDDDIAPEYDFSGGKRGKHSAAMRNGYTILVHRNDGTTEMREVAPRPGSVMLDPDVRAYFPDSDAVNRALRGLIRLIPRQATPNETR